MVYYGRPSVSCDNCRIKKRRCDRVLPECGQCRRMGQKCSGSRDPASIIFRDESSHVADKARSRSSNRTASPHDRVSGNQPMLRKSPDPPRGPPAGSSADSFLRNGAGVDGSVVEGEEGSRGGTGTDCRDDGHRNSPGGFRDDNTSETSISPPLSLPPKTIGLNYFLSHYIVRYSPPSSGFLDYVLDILAQERSEDMLEAAILALGFTGLARSTQQRDLIRLSMAMYAQAIEHVNRALADPNSARQNSTIITVLVLALYEFGESSLEGWKHHIQGAATLLALRGRSRFTTAVGLRIFKDVLFHVLTNCLYTGCPLHSDLRMLHAEAVNATSASDPYWVSTSAMIELLDLHQKISPSGYTYINNSAVSRPDLSNIPVEDVERYLSQALEIDHRLQQHFSERPSEWQFTVIQDRSSSRDPACFYGDTFHIYQDLWVANVWNSMRTCRILANYAVHQLLLRGANVNASGLTSNHYADRLQQVARTLVHICDDIIASVPQQMGHVVSSAQQQQQCPRHSTLTSTTPGPGFDITNAFLSSSLRSPSVPPSSLDEINYTGSAVGSYFASWVLLMVGCMHCTEDKTRAWIAAQLRQVSSRVGLSQADKFADCVESNKLRSPLG